MACFILEAEARTAQGSHGRAAIAFRAAAEQARLQGLAEQCEQLLDRAATAYTHAAKRGELSLGAAHQAWVSAAKCFLQLQELDQAARCIEEARHVADQARGNVQSGNVQSAQTAS
jgi:tetratricopeptide (TPR) repeat protein